MPAAELPRPPPKKWDVLHFGNHLAAERVGIRSEQAESVNDRVLLIRVPLLVGLVECLHHLFEDRLHTRPPLVPEPLRDSHHRIGCAVAVREDARVKHVDAGCATGIGEIDELHLVDQ